MTPEKSCLAHATTKDADPTIWVEVQPDGTLKPIDDPMPARIERMAAIVQRMNGKPGDPRIKRPCPLCGETEHLDYRPYGFDRAVVVDGDTVKDERGHEVTEQVAIIECYVCLTNAPADSWNGEVGPEVYAVLRDFDPPVQARPRRVSRREIEAAMTPGGAWTRATLAGWGVPWPPPAGWKAALEAGKEIPRRG